MKDVLKTKEGNIYNPHIPRYDYDIGDIFLTTNNKNPNKRFGGTWELIAKGKTLVGVDPDDTDFATVKKTGGSKKVKLDLENYGYMVWIGDPNYSHNDIKAYWNYSQGSNGLGLSYKSNRNTPHENLQPYFTCYIWMKTAN